MTNLVATTPVTAKAMQNLLLELHRQRELKKAYRQHYRDIQTTSTSTAVTTQPLTSIASTNKSTTPVKTTGSQVKKPVGKNKVAKPIDKGKKRVAFGTTTTPTATTSPASISNLRNKLRDKAKVTVAMIQELTEDLQSMDQDSVMEGPESVITQESELEQEIVRTI